MVPISVCQGTHSGQGAHPLKPSGVRLREREEVTAHNFGLEEEKGASETRRETWETG